MAVCLHSWSGTMMLLEEEEKRLVKGLVINKFRGDKSILDPGNRDAGAALTSIPVVGVASVHGH